MKKYHFCFLIVCACQNNESSKYAIKITASADASGLPDAAKPDTSSDDIEMNKKKSLNDLVTPDKMGVLKPDDCPDTAKERNEAILSGDELGIRGVRGHRNFTASDYARLRSFNHCSINEDCGYVIEKCNCGFQVNKRNLSEANLLVQKFSCEKPACCIEIPVLRCIEERCVIVK